MKSRTITALTLATLAAIAISNLAVQAAETVLLSDNFNTANGTTLAAVNANLETRQSGTFSPSTYAYYFGSNGVSINNDQLGVGVDRGFINNADFKTALTDPVITGFKVSFKLASTGTNWVSPFLSTHPASDDRGASEFGFLIYADGTVQAYATGPDKAASGADIHTALGGTWNRTAQNTYELVATPATTDSGTYDVFINGVEVISDVSYTFGTGGGNGQINFEIRTPANGTGIFDDFQISSFSPDPPPFNLTITPNGTNFDFSWDSQPGKIYDLLTSTDLATPIAGWPIYNDGVMLRGNIPATGSTTTLTDVLPSGPRRFFAIREETAPPLFFADFEGDDNGGFTTSKTAGSDWQWGTPASTGFGGTVNSGNGVPASFGKCWGTNIGTPGFYTDPTIETCLISPEIDLTEVAGAELRFAHVMDFPGDDEAILRIVNADTNIVIQSIAFTDDDDTNADWSSSGPIVLPVDVTIRLEWCFSGTGAAFDDYMGWYIDDVWVMETAP